MIYLDNSATTRKKPISVVISALKEMLLAANAGRGGHKASIRTALLIEKTRAEIKSVFFDGNVIFTKNCTEALNLGIIGIKPQGRVVTTVYEHNSVLRVLKKLENDKQIKLVIVEPKNGSLINAFYDAITSDTSLVVFTAMSNVTGEKFNVEMLAKIVKSRSKATVIVDMAQAAGHMTCNFVDVDMIASSGHKGLLGLQGTGFLLCKKHIKLDPIVFGGTGTSSNSIDIPKTIPEGMEAGTLNGVGIISLFYGVRYAYKNFRRINTKILRLSNYFYRALKQVKGIKLYACNSGIVLCNFEKIACNTATDILSREYGICARSGLHCAPLIHNYLGTSPSGAIRFSFGDSNDMAQTLWAISAMKKIAESVTKNKTFE